MTVFIAIALFALNGFATTAPPTDEAATLLSRFPIGALPNTPGVVQAIGILGASGDPEIVPLLESLVAEEGPAVQACARHALGNFHDRARLSFRDAFRPPGPAEVGAWLGQNNPVGPHHEKLQRHERWAVAYTSLILGDTVGPFDAAWKTKGAIAEAKGDTQTALRQYTSAVVNGHFDAISDIRAFDINIESFLLGLLTALPPSHPTHDALLDWLVTHGTIKTTRVLAERAIHKEATERAKSLEAMGRMIQAGKLNPRGESFARRRLELSLEDPNDDVRIFAQTTLLELSEH
jgi:hypothetical protein